MGTVNYLQVKVAERNSEIKALIALNLGVPIDKVLLEAIQMREETEIIEARIRHRKVRIEATNASLATISALRLANNLDNLILMGRREQ